MWNSEPTLASEPESTPKHHLQVNPLPVERSISLLTPLLWHLRLTFVLRVQFPIYNRGQSGTVCSHIHLPGSFWVNVLCPGCRAGKQTKFYLLRYSNGLRLFKPISERVEPFSTDSFCTFSQSPVRYPATLHRETDARESGGNIISRSGVYLLKTGVAGCPHFSSPHCCRWQPAAHPLLMMPPLSFQTTPQSTGKFHTVLETESSDDSLSRTDCAASQLCLWQ